MEKLFEHQSDIIHGDPLWAGIFLGTGGGKTRIALELAHGSTLIICPKQQFLDQTWQRNAQRFSVVLNMTVISKETFRRDWAMLPKFDTIIIDEAHHFFGVLPDTRTYNGNQIAKTSQMFESLLRFTRKYPPERFYLCTATPVSKPINIWAIATLFGKKWNFLQFREKYYFSKKAGWRQMWIPRSSPILKDRLVELIKSFGYTGKLSDWFDVPEQIHITRHVSLTSEQKAALKKLQQEEADPMAKRTKQRTIENGCMYEYELKMLTPRTERMVRVSRYYDSEKIDAILEYAREFPKMLIFANYIAQIEAIEKVLKGAGYSVVTVTGETKDRSTIFQKADASNNCIVICQSGISEGYEFKQPLGAVIFASKSYRYLYYEQALGRPLRADALNKNLFIHLVVKGGIDQRCHETIMAGKDWQEKLYE